MNNFWNKTTISVVIGLVLLLLVAGSFYFFYTLPAKPIYSYAVIDIAAIILIIAIIYMILAATGRVSCKGINYRQLFFIGIIWFIAGLPARSGALTVIGLVFMTVGLVNKKKWQEEIKWQELPSAKKRLKLALVIILVLLVLAIGMVWYLNIQKKSAIADFATCAAAGNSVMESYPRLCRAGDKTFAEIVPVGNDKIKVLSLLPDALVQSPLKVAGEARGTWYFEASFPVKLVDGNGQQLAAAPAQARGDWMTADFVPFEAVLNFDAPQTATGFLVLEKDNPSGLTQNAESFSVPVRFNP